MCLCLWWTHELAFSFRLKEKGWKGKRFRNTVKEGTIRKVSPKFSCLNEFLLGLSLPSHNSTGLGHESCLVPYSLPPAPRQQPATCGGGTVVVAHTCHSSSQGAKQKPKWQQSPECGDAGWRSCLSGMHMGFIPAQQKPVHSVLSVLRPNHPGSNLILDLNSNIHKSSSQHTSHVERNLSPGTGLATNLAFISNIT